MMAANVNSEDSLNPCMCQGTTSSWQHSRGSCKQRSWRLGPWPSIPPAQLPSYWYRTIRLDNVCMSLLHPCPTFHQWLCQCTCPSSSSWSFHSCHHPCRSPSWHWAAVSDDSQSPHSHCLHQYCTENWHLTPNIIKFSGSYLRIVSIRHGSTRVETGESSSWLRSQWGPEPQQQCSMD